MKIEGVEDGGGQTIEGDDHKELLDWVQCG